MGGRERGRKGGREGWRERGREDTEEEEMIVAMVEVFEKFGDVGDVFIPTDRESGRPRGFAFVRFVHKRDAEDAMDDLNGRQFDGRELRVSIDEGRPRGGGRGGYGGGGRGGGRGYGGGRDDRGYGGGRDRGDRDGGRRRSDSRDRRRSR